MEVPKNLGLELSYGEGNGNPLQYSCLENPMNGGAWQAAVHGVAKSWARLSDFNFTFHFHALEKEMTTYSSVLAWRIPETVGPHLWGGTESDTTEATQQQGLIFQASYIASSISVCTSLFCPLATGPELILSSYLTNLFQGHLPTIGTCPSPGDPTASTLSSCPHDSLFPPNLQSTILCQVVMLLFSYELLFQNSFSKEQGVLSFKSLENNSLHLCCHIPSLNNKEITQCFKLVE